MVQRHSRARAYRVQITSVFLKRSNDLRSL